MTACEQTPTEVANSINGFDEIAIAKAFGEKMLTLKEDPFAFLRSLAFTHQRREGHKDAEAYQAAMELTYGDLAEYFAEEPDEPMPDEPVTDAGKGEPPSPTSPEPRPTSASAPGSSPASSTP